MNKTFLIELFERLGYISVSAINGRTSEEDGFKNYIKVTADNRVFYVSVGSGYVCHYVYSTYKELCRGGNHLVCCSSATPYYMELCINRLNKAI